MYFQQSQFYHTHTKKNIFFFPLLVSRKNGSQAASYLQATSANMLSCSQTPICKLPKQSFQLAIWKKDRKSCSSLKQMDSIHVTYPALPKLDQLARCMFVQRSPFVEMPMGSGVPTGPRGGTHRDRRSNNYYYQGLLYISWVIQSSGAKEFSPLCSITSSSYTLSGRGLAVSHTLCSQDYLLPSACVNLGDQFWLDSCTNH